MIKYIHHISDVHIRLLKRHSEYVQVFNNLYTKIRENLDESVIVLTGDLVHSKLEISPELIDIASKFFVNLANLTKVIIIPGNHDCNLSNLSRLDTLSPMIENLKHKNIIYSKNTEVIEIDNIQFAHSSIFSEKKDYIKASELEQDKIKIALYHGVVGGADFGGFMVKSADMNVSDFNGFDIVLLGDVHGNQRLQYKNVIEKKPEIWYAGSLLQNNYGEGLNKGYLLWNVNLGTPEFIPVGNDYGYHTVEVDNGQYTIPTDFSKKPRIRLKVTNTTASDIHRISTDLRKVFEVQELIVNNLENLNLTTKIGKKNTIVDVRNVQIQNQLIRTHLEVKHQIDDKELLDKICSINIAANKNLPQNETIRNVIWFPKTFEFSNMFSYGEDNKVNLGILKNIIGLFAPNAAGKSSLIDALLFCIFDRSSRAYKGANILNNKKLTFHCKFNFEIDGMNFCIERRGYKQKTGNVKVDVDFWTYGDDGKLISLNGNDRDETNQNIRSYVGTYEDFVSTSLSFQNNNESFIEKSQTERKDFLAKFLDISIFDELYTLANEKTKKINILLNEYKKQDFSEKLSEFELNYETSKIAASKFLKEKESLEGIVTNLNSQILAETELRIKTTSDFVDVDELEITKKNNNLKVSNLSFKLDKIKNVIIDSKTKAVDLFNKINILKEENTQDVYEEYKDIQKQFNSKNLIFEKEKIKIEQKKKVLYDLEKHEYDPNCKYCVNNIFVKNAITTKNELLGEEEKYNNLETEINEISRKIQSLKHIEQKYIELISLSKQLDEQKVIALKNENEKNSLDRDIEHTQADNLIIENKIENYEKNKESIQHNLVIDKKINEIKVKLSNISSNKKDTEHKLQESIIKIEVCKNEMSKIHTLIQNAKEMEISFKAHDLYSKSINRDGVPYDLIANTIPTLQEEVNDILSQIVDFNILFNLDGKNVNAFIAYDDTKYWSIELCSGMEKFISALAIRCALINVSNLPRPTFLAIDEGFGVLDADNISSLGYLFDYLKQKFEFVLIISHIDTMKDMVDYAVEIVKENDMSKITHE